MERQSQSRSDTLPAVSLYLDDVEDAIAVFTEAGATVAISDEEYSFDSLDELIARRGRSPARLYLQSEGSGLTLRLRRNHIVGVYLSTWGRKADDLGYFQLKDLLRRRRTFASRVLVPPVWFGIAAVVGLIGILQAAKLINAASNDALGWTFFLASALGMLGMLVQAGLGPRSISHGGMRQHRSGAETRTSSSLA